MPKFGGIVEELDGSNIEAIKLITKVLPRCKHFIRPTHGAIKESYGGENELSGTTGKGILFSGSVCRDVSCLTFK